MNDKTLSFYDDNAELYAEGTFKVDIGSIQEEFLSYLKKGDCILDLGCGAGRDSLYFLNQGYRVVAVDGSKELCRIASRITGLEVRNLLFSDLDYKDTFDGIWACASLLHVPSEELPDVLNKCFAALKAGGIFYLSFKKGSFEGERDGRYFSDLEEEKIREILSSLGYDNKIEKLFITDDARGREEKWVNILARKI